MKIHFRFFLSHVKFVKNLRKIQVYRLFSPILLWKARQCRGVTYDVIDELRRLSLSKSCSALCHKLIYEIAIFHSINGETCDKAIYVFLTEWLKEIWRQVHAKSCLKQKRNQDRTLYEQKTPETKNITFLWYRKTSSRGQMILPLNYHNFYCSEF